MSVISILGMHRSGTSCLTGLLENAGLELGNVSRQNPHNKKGNNENSRIMLLHERVLAANNSSWDSPPESGCRWAPEQLNELREIILHHSHLQNWGFKDPRTLFTLEGWLETVQDIQLVGTFRHPLAVAASLVARGGGEIENYIDLWQRYNERLLYFHDKFAFDLVSFDAPPEIYLDRVRSAAMHLGLDSFESALNFYDEKLRTQQAGTANLPKEAKKLYRTLLERAL